MDFNKKKQKESGMKNEQIVNTYIYTRNKMRNIRFKTMIDLVLLLSYYY